MRPVACSIRLTYTAMTESDSLLSRTTSWPRFSNLKESPANHCASQMPASADPGQGVPDATRAALHCRTHLDHQPKCSRARSIDRRNGDDRVARTFDSKA